MELSQLIAALRRPEAHPRPNDRVEVLQTHVSVLFFAGDRVYKVKKPVDLGFCDFTTLERRLFFCREEVRLNRRLTPWMYRGVVPIVRGAGDALRIDSQGEPVEWAVEMERLPHERMLARMLERGEVDNALMDQIVTALTRFHAGAATGAGVDEYGAPDAVAGNAGENFEQLTPFVGDVATAGSAVLSPELATFLEARARGFLRDERELLEERVRAGRVRDGHGDLHAENVCFTPRGVAIYDCIEFAPRFRCSDVACDLAFLAMDLDHRGFSGFARYLVRGYAGAAQDDGLVGPLAFYKTYRAVVRGKVAAMTAADPGLGPEARERERRRAMSYLHLAAAYDLPPAMILMCGLPGSGKSWLARELARPLHAVHARSDVRRRVVAGAIHDEPQEYGAGAYTAELKTRTYRSLLDTAVEALESGRSVVVDATFARAEWRRPFVDAAARLGHPFFVVHVTADEALVRERLERRAEDAREASQAGWDTYLHAREEFEPPGEVPTGHVVAAASGQEAPEVAAARLVDLRIATAP